jgi:ribonuclease E
MRARDDDEEAAKSKSKRKSARKSASVDADDAVATSEEIEGMETIALDDDEDGEAGAAGEGLSPMTTVGETPVETPSSDDDDEDTDDAEVTPETEAEPSEDVAGTDDPDSLPETAAETELTDSEEDDKEDESEAEASDEKPSSGRSRRRRGSRQRSNAADKDENIESVADDDDQEDIRPPRKPRPRRYKIQEVIKVRQILLVQVVKEERGNKGAALTTYLSLAGRYCVLMPNTARGGGISRKITNAADRKKLKEIANEIDVPTGAGLIVRTAGAKRTKSEIKRDYEYLQRMWEQIRELTLKSIAPAQIYEEGNLIKRSIRDLYNREIDEVMVEGDAGYRVESYLSSMFNPTVQLKSGGYIVIGATEALVAIDVNSGRATKEGSIEETALKTNLEAAEEVARQLRLRDLAGLIVIDFIDMDERKNNNAVEKRLKDRLKSDRARIQVGRISGFGLLEMSRQRLRPGMIEATTQPCPHCHGTGLIRSDDSLALSILRQIEEEGVRRRSREVLIKCPIGISNFLMNQKRDHVAQIEARYGLSVRVEGDPSLIPPDYSIEKFKTATRIVPDAGPVVSVDSSIMDEVDEAEDAQVEDAETLVEDGEDPKPKKRRRRRRRRSKSRTENGEENTTSTEETVEQSEPSDDESKNEVDASENEEEKAEKPKRQRRSRSTKKKAEEAPADADARAETVVSDEAKPEENATETPEKEEKPKRKRAPRKKKAEAVVSEEPSAEPANDVPEAIDPLPEPETGAETPTAASAEVVPEPAPEPEPAQEAAPEPAVTEEPEPSKPKRRGWWSTGR